MNTTKPQDEIWADFEAVAGKEPQEVPEGALFNVDIQERFQCSRSTAGYKMRQAVESGWKSGHVIRNGSITKYIYK